MQEVALRASNILMVYPILEMFRGFALLLLFFFLPHEEEVDHLPITLALLYVFPYSFPSRLSVRFRGEATFHPLCLASFL